MAREKPCCGVKSVVLCSPAKALRARGAPQHAAGVLRGVVHTAGIRTPESWNSTPPGAALFEAQAIVDRLCDRRAARGSDLYTKEHSKAARAYARITSYSKLVMAKRQAAASAALGRTCPTRRRMPDAGAKTTGAKTTSRLTSACPGRATS
jgi:hypothetical protein